MRILFQEEIELVSAGSLELEEALLAVIYIVPIYVLFMCGEEILQGLADLFYVSI